MSLNKIRIGITGGDGFLGSKVVELLQNYPIFEVIKYDPRQNVRFVPEIKFFFHFGSSIKPASFRTNSFDAENEIFLFRNLLIKLNSFNIDTHHIFPSTSNLGSNYTYEEDLFSPEKSALTAYADFKITLENIVISNVKNYYILRISTVYGFGQRTGRNQGVFNEWLSSINNHSPRKIFGPLDSTRDYLYIKDFQTGILNLLNLASNGNYSNFGTFNLGNGTSYTLEEAMNIFDSIFKNDLINVHESRYKVDNYTSKPNSYRFMNSFNWTPKFNLASGLMDWKKKL